MEWKHACYNALQLAVRGYLQDDRRVDRGDERVVILQPATRPAIDRVKNEVADEAERVAALQRRRGDAPDRRGGGVVAGVKHGARRPVRHAVIGSALLVGDRRARTPKDHRSALGDEGLGPIPAVAGQAESQPFLHRLLPLPLRIQISGVQTSRSPERVRATWIRCYGGRT